LLEGATHAHSATTDDERTNNIPRARISVWVPLAEAGAASRQLRTTLRAAHRRGILGTVKLEEATVLDDAWASSWKKFYKPFPVAHRLFIVPSWERSFKPPRGSSVLRLDPGMAFGTGQHPTTQMALALLLRRVRRGSVVADVGCGSGILGLAAAQRGALVYASDADAIAVAATRKNFALNGVRARAVMKARDVPSAFPRADIVVANITARVIERLAARLALILRAHGILIVSGLVDSGKARVLRSLSRAGLKQVECERAGEWYAFAHEK
jgi:ribosomal protein L11 methyltransferase